MAVKSFLNWVIIPREDWRNLERENDRLSNAVIVRDEQIGRLNKMLNAMKKDELCDGVHCQGCEHAIQTKSVAYVSDYGIRETHDVVCAKAVPCNSFKRKEE